MAKMHNKLIASTFSILLMLLLTSCTNPLEAFNKLEYFSYLNNLSGKKVTIKRNTIVDEETYILEPGEVLEVPDTWRWSLTNNPETSGEVIFTFDDGTSYIHKCEYADPDAIDRDKKYKFIPAENNILDLDMSDVGSWKKKSLKETNKYRLDYYIK